MADRGPTILVVMGTRPEAIKMAPLVLALRERPEPGRVGVVLTAQHREMSDEVLALFGIAPDHDLDIMRPRQSLYQTTARLLPGLEEVYRKEKQDGSGDIMIARDVYRDTGGDMQTQELGFLRIPNVRDVERRLKRLAEQASTSPLAERDLAGDTPPLAP